jgi:hypothetical protein
MAITPESLAESNIEDGHQAAIFCWAALPENQVKYPELKKLLFAIPNGGARGDDKRSNMIRGAKLKATGVKAGVSDMLLAVRRGSYCGLFLELKKFGGKPDKDQLEFIQAVHVQGYCAAVVVGWKQAVEFIVGYLEYKG